MKLVDILLVLSCSLLAGLVYWHLFSQLAKAAACR